MFLIDLILNLAGLLLWISWRAVPFDPLTKIRPATLTGTLRRAEPTRVRPWHFLLALLVLLLVRSSGYWWIGSWAVWSGSVPFGAITISFKAVPDWHGLLRMLIFSFASFASALMTFIISLVLLSLIHPRSSDADICHRFVRIQLGPVHGWSWPFKLLFPFIAVTMLWQPANYLLASAGIIPPALSWLHRIEQGLVLGLSSYLVGKFTVCAVLALHLINSYIHLGLHPIWNYLNTTAKLLLVPLNRFPLRLGKVDFTPLVGIVIVFIVAEFAENGFGPHRKFGLTWLFGQLPL
jgi:uncharacterized protein YggT (Ycf19 family)